MHAPIDNIMEKVLSIPRVPIVHQGRGVLSGASCAYLALNISYFCKGLSN